MPNDNALKMSNLGQQNVKKYHQHRNYADKIKSNDGHKQSQPGLRLNACKLKHDMLIIKMKTSTINQTLHHGIC